MIPTGQDGRGARDRQTVAEPAGPGGGEPSQGRPQEAAGRAPGSDAVICCACQAQGHCAHALRQLPHTWGPGSPASREASPRVTSPAARPLMERLPGRQPSPWAMRKWVPGRGFSWAEASGRGRGEAPGPPATPSGRPLPRPSSLSPLSPVHSQLSRLRPMRPGSLLWFGMRRSRPREVTCTDRGQTVGSPGLTPEPSPDPAPHLPPGRPLLLRHRHCPRPWLGPTRPPCCSLGSKPSELSCLPWGGSRGSASSTGSPGGA